MKPPKILFSYTCSILLTILFFILCGCGLSAPAKKPEVGPTGTSKSENPNPPLMQRFDSPPSALYDLEKTAGITFEGINKGNWPQAQEGLANLQAIWQDVKPLIGEKKGIKEADEALLTTLTSITNKNSIASQENLNKFMGSISEIGKSYKRSPLSDIIAIGNALRAVNFYTEDKNWVKASTKIKDLEGTWKQFKPSLEKAGILGEITKTHSEMNQLQDAILAENEGSVNEQLDKLNESLGKIREFYRGH